jgi:hypothetical protein
VGGCDRKLLTVIYGMSAAKYSGPIGLQGLEYGTYILKPEHNAAATRLR